MSLCQCFLVEYYIVNRIASKFRVWLVFQFLLLVSNGFYADMNDCTGRYLRSWEHPTGMNGNCNSMDKYRILPIIFIKGNHLQYQNSAKRTMSWANFKRTMCRKLFLTFNGFQTFSNAVKLIPQLVSFTANSGTCGVSQTFLVSICSSWTGFAIIDT